jgi:hypothetical protein
VLCDAGGGTVVSNLPVYAGRYFLIYSGRSIVQSEAAGTFRDRACWSSCW